MEKFKQGDEKILCTIVSISNPELEIEALIDSSFVNNLILNYDLINEFCELVGNDIMSFYELNGDDDDSISFDVGYRYYFSLNEP